MPSFHRPTRAVFALYPAPDAADLATLSIFQMPVCNGFPLPGDLPALAASAIIAFVPT
jgi:hypothetical protein